jgi:hypothetical protein
VELSVYWSSYQITQAVHSEEDLNELRQYIEMAGPTVDPSHIKQCKDALNVYDLGWFRRWSTPFLQEKVRTAPPRTAAIYQAEIERRGEESPSLC